MALNLGVTSCQSLEISLDQFVRGEVLEGSNAYYCEKCKEKVCICGFLFQHAVVVYLNGGHLSVQRTTVKRTCIKSLPSVLCIHLMRFGFDWESGRSIKYDEQIRVRTGAQILRRRRKCAFVLTNCIIIEVPLGAEHGAIHRGRNGPSRLQRRGRRRPSRGFLRRVAQEEGHHLWELRAGGGRCPQWASARRTLLFLH